MTRARLNVTIDVSGMDRVLRETPAKAEEWLDMEAEETVNDIKLSFNTSPPGRAYKRGSVMHVASQPEYPPNVDLGTLRESVRWARAGRLRRRIMDGVEYGIYLEFGAKFMDPRPFMRPALERLSNRLPASAKRAGLVE